MTKAIPEGFHTLTAMFVFKDARKAIDFYKMAFNAKELSVMPGPDGKGIMHAEVKIGDSIIMMGDQCPGQSSKSIEDFGGSPVSFYLYVENVDSAFSRAVEAGATVDMPVQDMFWGDRAGSLKDPFGYSWMLGTHTKDLSEEEIKQGAQKAFAEMAQKK